MPVLFQRVVVIGSSGAGKSTFARRLGDRTGLPVTHIDQLFWQRGWVQAPKDVYLARLAHVVAQDRWIIEGVSPSTLDLRFPRTDTVFWLHRGRTACLWRVARRVASSYGRVRPDMAPGCPERGPDLEFIRYIWTYPTRIAPRIDEAIVRHRLAGCTIHLHSDRAAQSYLDQLAVD